MRCVVFVFIVAVMVSLRPVVAEEPVAVSNHSVHFRESGYEFKPDFPL
jgi:hypothetical protein